MEEYWNISELILELTFEESPTSLQFTPSLERSNLQTPTAHL